MREIPEGSWYCSQCTCWICGDVVDDKDATKSPDALKCSQCEHKCNFQSLIMLDTIKSYHEACLKDKCIEMGQPDTDTWFCGESCLEVYSGLQSRIGLMNHVSDDLSWTLLRCIHGDQKVHSAQRFVALKAECNSKLAVAVTIMEECFLPMVDPRTGIDMIPHVLYNWGSQFARLNYHGFYTVVLEKDDVLISVASIRIHGVTVAEMPLIATCSKYRRQGMCRRLVNAIEEMLKSVKVENLVISAIPSLVETWTVGFGFIPLKANERRALSNINLMIFPGTVWLKKSLKDNHVVDAEQEAGSCHASPSGTNNPTETGGAVLETAEQSDISSSVKEDTTKAESDAGACSGGPVFEPAEQTYTNSRVKEDEIKMEFEAGPFSEGCPALEPAEHSDILSRAKEDDSKPKLKAGACSHGSPVLKPAEQPDIYFCVKEEDLETANGRNLQ
ncbi:hypothetical protein RJ640_004365, partial [Escallonia rubra]